MHEALTFLGEMGEADRAWFLDGGKERQVIAGSQIIREGTDPDSLYFVLEGLVGVHLAILDDRQLAVLGPGGKVILGNFHPRNPNKAFMDHVLAWRLIHRTEDDMDRLFAASRFARPSTRIQYEPQQVNLFAECVKQ